MCMRYNFLFFSGEKGVIFPVPPQIFVFSNCDQD